MLVYLNGDFLDDRDAVIPATDRGFIFGDGVYEVWRVVGGRLFEEERHLSRLARGLRELEIPPPAESRREVLHGIADRLLAANGLAAGEATLYLEITRGAAPRTHYFPPPDTPPTVFVAAHSFEPPQELREAGASAITQPDVRWLRCDLKTIQLLPNVLGKQRARERGAIEAVFVRDGRITEATHSGVFGVLDGELRTHPADNFVLPSVTRAVILELARELGIRTREAAIPVADLPRLEELFIVGTTMDVMPIVRLDERQVGAGRPGPVARALFSALRARLDAAGARARAPDAAGAAAG